MSDITSRPLLIADSRGRGLEVILRNKGVEATVISNPGKGAVISSLTSCKYIRRLSPTLIVLCGSICDITYRSSTVPYFKLRYESVAESTKFYIDQVKEAIGVLHNFFPDTPVQLTPVIGIDLRVYNNPGAARNDQYQPYELRTFDTNQMRMNDTIASINDEVICINRDNGIPNPWTANVIHARKGSKTFHRYFKLSDGCHLEAHTQVEWCKMLLLSFSKFTQQED